MREKLSISDEHLQICLREHYNIHAAILHFLPLGLDTHAGMYRVVSEQSTTYLLKAKSGLLYEPSCFIPRYLADMGVTPVVAPLPTQHDTLWTTLKEWTITIYPFSAI